MRPTLEEWTRNALATTAKNPVRRRKVVKTDDGKIRGLMPDPAQGSWSVSLPWPPSVNRVWRKAGAKMILAEGVDAYRARVFGAVLTQGRRQFGAVDLSVVISAHVPDAQRRDLDNLFKAPLDALAKAGVYDDDSQIVDLRIFRAGIDRENPRLIVWINPA